MPDSIGRLDRHWNFGRREGGLLVAALLTALVGILLVGRTANHPYTQRVTATAEARQTAVVERTVAARARQTVFVERTVAAQAKQTAAVERTATAIVRATRQARRSNRAVATATVQTGRSAGDRATPGPETAASRASDVARGTHVASKPEAAGPSSSRLDVAAAPFGPTPAAGVSRT